MGRIAAVGLLAAWRAPAGAAQGGPGRPPLANRCFALRSVATGHFLRHDAGGAYRADVPARKGALRLWLKPTALGTYMAHDGGGGLLAAGDGAATARTTDPGPAAEWSIWRLRRRSSYRLRSTSSGRVLAADPETAAVRLSERAGRESRFR